MRIDPAAKTLFPSKPGIRNEDVSQSRVFFEAALERSRVHNRAGSLTRKSGTTPQILEKEASQGKARRSFEPPAFGTPDRPSDATMP